MTQLVSGLPPVITNPNPPRTFLHEIAYKKVHDVALSCLELLAYFFIKIFCCFYPSYDRFYSEELAKKPAPAAPPVPPSVSGAAQPAAAAPEPIIVRTLPPVGAEEAPSAPQRTIVRSPSPVSSEPDFDFPIERRVGELSAETLFPPASEMMQPVATTNAISPSPVEEEAPPPEDRLQAPEENLIEHRAEAGSCPNQRMELETPPSLSSDLGGDVLTPTAVGDVSPIRAVEETVEPKITKLKLRGELWDYTEGRIAGLKDSPYAREREAQYITLNTRRVVFKGYYKFDEADYCNLNNENKITVKNVAGNPKKIEIVIPEKSEAYIVDLTKPYRRYCRIDGRQIDENVYVTNKTYISFMTGYLSQFYGQLPTPEEIESMGQTPAPARSASPSREESSESEDMSPTVSEPPVATAPVVVERAIPGNLYTLKDLTLLQDAVSLGWGGRYLKRQHPINKKHYQILFCKQTHSGRWWSDIHPDLTPGGEIVIKNDESQSVGFYNNYIIEMHKPSRGGLQETFLFHRQQLYYRTAEKDYVFLARLREESGKIPPGLERADPPKEVS